MATGDVKKTDSVMQDVAEDPNLIRVYGVGEFNVMFEASPAAAADLVVELHKRGVAVEALPLSKAPEAES